MIIEPTEGTPLIIDLGCGACKLEGSIGIDEIQFDGVDVVHNLNEGIPCDDNSVDAVYASHFLEHVGDLDFMLDEIHRVCKPSARVHIILPYVQHQMAFSPGHTMQISPSCLNVMGWDNSNIVKFIHRFHVDEVVTDYDDRGVALVGKHFPDMNIEDAAHLFWNVATQIQIICKPIKEEQCDPAE